VEGAMTENSKTVAAIKGQVAKFSGIIAKDLPKPKRKLVKEIIYGIQAAKDIKLSHITRALNESIPLIIKYEDGKEQQTTIFYNALTVRLPGREHPLCLVVVKGFGRQPMMLLTSCPVQLKTKESIWRIVEIHLTRWKCDESFRYIKQCYNLEDMRVRSYVSTRNIVVLVLAVAYFAAVYLGDNLRHKMLVEQIYLVSKQFFGVPTFFNYAIADGLYNLLFPDKAGINAVARAKKPEFQLCFSFWEESG
jgi:hypothetical protein